jgi:hypothetical protein
MEFFIEVHTRECALSVNVYVRISKEGERGDLFLIRRTLPTDGKLLHSINIYNIFTLFLHF